MKRSILPPAVLMAAGVFCLFPAATLNAQAQHRHDAPAQVLAPGYRVLEYDAPEPGTYQLPPLGRAGSGLVLDEAGRERPLDEFLGDKFVVLSFIFTSCNDVNGCPLATFVLGQLQQRLDADMRLKDQVRMVSLSFDPDFDTPQVMVEYGRKFSRNGYDWRFLTTASAERLQPLLRGFNQSVQKEYNEAGEYTGNISHILRVFLLDREKQVRNIYSVSFLHADTVINDIITLAMESGDDGFGAAPQPTAGAGEGGASEGALSGLPALEVPENNPLTQEKILLGRQLFFDRRLSHNNTLSCAMCHIPEQGFTSQELSVAIGIEGRTLRRNAPTLYNVGFARVLFHDARENLLEQQVWTPLLARNEMANPSVGFVIDRLKSLPEYRGKFEQAFDGKGPGMETVGMALASYQRTLNSAGSAFDRWYYGGEEDALGEQAAAGFRLFTGKARCVSCHTVNRDYALFTDHGLHNTGIGYLVSMGTPDDKVQVTVAPGTTLTVDREFVTLAGKPAPNDLGYYEITGDPDDRWKYRTPILRNVALSAPYMHNGSLRTLREVVEFYNRGGIKNELLDPLVQPLGLSDTEIDSIVAFLNSLTGSNVDELVADALSQP
ncbi:MAG: SCO family protein, partial [Gammaproteobacteria bacterium]|nr:SCO family protein [Gammaproteobacteria bacterium]